MMVSSCGYWGCHWSSSWAFFELARTMAASPGRFGPVDVFTVRPVTFSTHLMTWRTEKPFPLPRL